MFKFKDIFSENKIVYIAVEDLGDGIAEVKEIREDEVVLQWIVFTAAYKAIVYDETMYTKDQTVKLNLIQEATPIEDKNKTKEQIQQERNKSIEYDKDIFDRYRLLNYAKCKDCYILKNFII